MQKPLVSVIVPIYNAQNNIVRCVESIRRQTYENLEILLLNDGSKDVSYPVCETHGLQYSECRKSGAIEKTNLI